MPRPTMILIGFTAALLLALNYINFVPLPPLASGQTLLDFRPLGYSVQDALDWVAGMSEAGRALYLGAFTYLDGVFMICFALSLAALGMHLTPSWTVPRIGICIFAAVYLYADIQEGYLLRQLLNLQGEQGVGIYAAIASLSTKVKFAAVLVAGLWLAGLWWKQRKTT